MLVSSLENFRISRELGFTLQGIKHRHRNKAEKMQPGDRIIYYVTGQMKIAGIATITGRYYEDHTLVWRSEKKGEDYPFRFAIEPFILLEESEFVPVQDLVPQMAYTKKWPEAHWRLAFQGNVHLLPESDYLLMEDAIRQAVAARV
ncbi:MAG: EVE domain-containing protein [Chloroflexi bacterium]|nr:EVE domain-containing protein [Chloroflexota bacterium]